MNVHKLNSDATFVSALIFEENGCRIIKNVDVRLKRTPDEKLGYVHSVRTQNCFFGTEDLSSEPVKFLALKRQPGVQFYTMWVRTIQHYGFEIRYLHNEKRDRPQLPY